MGDAAGHPGRTTREAARAVAEEQGPFAFMSGQTKPDMDRKIKEEESRVASKKLDDFSQARGVTQDEFRDAWEECGTQWTGYDDQIRVAQSTVRAEDREAVVKDLKAKQQQLKVSGPSTEARPDAAGKKIRPQIDCRVREDQAQDRIEIREAYGRALGEINRTLQQQEGDRLAELGRRRTVVAQSEKVRRQFRRQIFREEFQRAMAASKLDALVTDLEDANHKKTVVNSYLAERWSRSDTKQFYLKDWAPVPIPAKAKIDWKWDQPAPDPANDWSLTPEFGQWVQREETEWPQDAAERKLPDAENKYLDHLSALWKSVFRDTSANDELTRPQAWPWLEADFQKWRQDKRPRNAPARREDRWRPQPRRPSQRDAPNLELIAPPPDPAPPGGGNGTGR